jgi:hypothetical protein
MKYTRLEQNKLACGWHQQQIRSKCGGGTLPPVTKAQKRVGRDKGSPRSRCVCLEQADAGFTDDRQRSLSRTHITLTTPASGMSHYDNQQPERA